MNKETLGQLSFEAYENGISANLDYPRTPRKWELLPVAQQNAWIASAQAVAIAFAKSLVDGLAAR